MTEGESRDKLGEWLKKTQVRHQDQRRMLESIMHCFPSNFWRNKITNSKESDKYDLCKELWKSQGRFTTEEDLPIQTLGHIHHTCAVLSELHTMTHHDGDSYTEISHVRHLLSGASYVSIVKNASVWCGKNLLSNFQWFSINVQNKHSGMWQEIQK